MSICDCVSDHNPIFKQRLSDESGGKITGGRATIGN